MTLENPFDDLMTRVRKGDGEAARELVQSYEPTIRRVIRFRLTDARLRKAFDSMDICQSVLGSFFLRANAGAFDIDSPEQLIKVLATMARNKLASQARKETAQRRDMRRQSGGDEAALAADRQESPSQVVMAQELVDKAQQRLSPEEQKLIELRKEGKDWDQIAAELGENAVALRKRFSRALARVARDLGLDEGEDEEV